MLSEDVYCPGVGQHSSSSSVNSQHDPDCTGCRLRRNDCNSTGEDSVADMSAAASDLEELQPDVLYHILVLLTQQDVAHVKMCSKRLQGNILSACQHWAPKVASWLAADPSSAGLLQQLRGAGGRQLQPPASHSPQPPPPFSSGPAGADAVSSMTDALLKQQAAAAALPGADQEAMQDSIPAAHSVKALLGGEEEAAGTTCTLPADVKLPKGINDRLDWRQVWSCLERAQTGPWQLDARRLTPEGFPHGVLLTFELLLQQPAPPAEPGAREQHTGGWRDCVTVLSFTLDGKTVEITVDASGKVTSPQRDWGQGSIKLQPGQPKLLALEVSYLFPVAAWSLHPCTLAAPKLPCTSSNSSLNSSGGSSCASSLSFTTQDHNWDSYSLAASSSGSSIGQRCAALCLPCCHSMFGAATGRPRLCLDLSCGVGSYVSDPRCIDEALHNQKPRGIERLELPGRVCWRPSKVQSWLGRLLPGIRAHSGSSSSSSGGHTGSSSAGGAPSSTHASRAGAGTHSSSSGGGGCIVGSPMGGTARRDSCCASFAVTASKAAVWQVPEDPDFRFSEGVAFWVVQHKAEQLLEHYGILPPWQGCTSAGRMR